jgi:hypothetical protein
MLRLLAAAASRFVFLLLATQTLDAGHSCVAMVWHHGMASTSIRSVFTLDAGHSCVAMVWHGIDFNSRFVIAACSFDDTGHSCVALRSSRGCPLSF